MIHGLNNNFLYSAFKLEAGFQLSSGGKVIAISGTAFFVRVRDIMYLVTNRHNLDLQYKDQKYKGFELKSLSLTGRFSGDKLQVIELDSMTNGVVFANDHMNDVACIPAPSFKLPIGERVVLDYFLSEGLIAGASEFQRDLSVCDFVAFPGYPEWHDNVDIRPIFRGGTIASDPRQSFHHKSAYGEIGGDSVAYEAFSFGGSSGSPVFALQKGIKPGPGIKFDDYRDARLIGINGGHFRSAESFHSGISYFYKSSVILEIAAKFDSATRVDNSAAATADAGSATSEEQ